MSPLMKMNAKSSSFVTKKNVSKFEAEKMKEKKVKFAGNLVPYIGNLENKTDVALDMKRKAF
jgi:aspartate-semialdehyde dehydrogenase